jgi:hypothetical protein
MKEQNLDWLLKYHKHWYVNDRSGWLQIYRINICHSKNNPVKFKRM